jgi:hypothetical protein
MGPHETKKLYRTKEMVIRLERQPTEQKNIFARYISDNGLITTKYR